MNTGSECTQSLDSHVAEDDSHTTPTCSPWLRLYSTHHPEDGDARFGCEVGKYFVTHPQENCVGPAPSPDNTNSQTPASVPETFAIRIQYPIQIIYPTEHPQVPRQVRKEHNFDRMFFGLEFAR